MSRPVATMPGKLGDLIFAVPAIRALADLYKTPVDLVTTLYCAPAIDLLLEQHDLIRNVRWDEKYRPTREGPGLQPIDIPIPHEFTADGHRDIFHLGLRRYPLPHERLHETIAKPFNLATKEGPWLNRVKVDEAGDTVVAAPLREDWEPPVLREILNRLKGRSVVLAGTFNECVMFDRMKLDREPGVTIKEITSLLEFWKLCDGARAFFGIASAPAVVAAASGLPCKWVLRPGVDRRWIPRGCDVTEVVIRP